MNFIQEVEKAIITFHPESLADCYNRAFNKRLDTGCSNCWRDAIIDLTKWLRKQDEPKAGINLFTMVYDVASQVRRSELALCMEMNKKLQDRGLITRIIKIKDLVTYQEIFSLTENYPDDINIVANSDIFFNDTIEHVHGIKRLQAYCLSRYDYIKGTGKAIFFNREDSQDVWIIRGYVRNVKCGFSQGRPGCDNRLAFELKKTGYEVSNPSLDIQTIHCHESNKRTYVNTSFNKVEMPYLLIYPHNLGAKPGILIRR